MPEPRKIILLGAEKQAAVNLALAYPEEQFVFVSKRKIIDGWDLSNVVLRVNESSIPELGADDLTICLSSEWSESLRGHDINLGNYRLKETIAHLFERFPENVLPISSDPTFFSPKTWIAKGDYMRKPDIILIGNDDTPDLMLEDDIGKVVFQEYLPNVENMMVLGRRNMHGGTALTSVKVYSEGFGREAFLLAGESIEDPILSQMIFDMLLSLDYIGFFTFNVVKTRDKYMVTSLRPVVRACVKTLLNSGIDLLNYNDGEGLKVGRAGKKFTADIAYNTFE